VGVVMNLTELRKANINIYFTEERMKTMMNLIERHRQVQKLKNLLKSQRELLKLQKNKLKRRSKS
jgi:hypothetical protein